jgi:hypothetical protein
MAAGQVEGAPVASGGLNEEAQAPLQHIAEALRGLRFGTVTVVVQDGVVVQVERTEKRRLRGGAGGPLRNQHPVRND